MNYPVVFIPGLFGSMGNEVIKGTGDFSFGFAEKIYRPFINILNAMGYEEGVDLFISYYDWKRSVLEAVNQYLCPEIERIKRKTKSRKVIIIGHSLGGLLGRAYMQYFAPSNVIKLIMIATPNLGAVNAYYFWSGGKLPYRKIEDNIIYNGLKLGFMMYLYLFHDIGKVEALRSMFPVVRDLLPSYEYGNYLFRKEDGLRRGIPIEGMSVENNLLNKLGYSTIDMDKIFIISGKEVFTNREFEVDILGGNRLKWQDGMPIKAYRSNYGDGTVTTRSALGNLGGDPVILRGNHTNILYKSKDYLSAILGRSLTRDVKIEKVESIDLIFIQDCKRVNVLTKDDNQITNAYMNIVDDRVQALNLGENNFGIMITGDKDSNIRVNTEPIKDNKSKVYRMAIRI